MTLSSLLKFQIPEFFKLDNKKEKSYTVNIPEGIANQIAEKLEDLAASIGMSAVRRSVTARGRNDLAASQEIMDECNTKMAQLAAIVAALKH